MAVLDELKTHLIAQGVTTAATCFTGVLPHTPDAVLALFEAPGAAPVHTFGGGAGSAIYHRPAVQLIGRAAADDGYEAARATVKNAVAKLDGLANTTLSGIRYLSIFAINDPHLIERDANERVLIGCDLQVEKDPS